MRNARFGASTCLISRENWRTSRTKCWFFCIHVSRLESLVFLSVRRVYGGSRKTSPFRMFPRRLSCRIAWQAWHFVPSNLFDNVSKLSKLEEVSREMLVSSLWFSCGVAVSMGKLRAPHSTLYTPRSTIYTLDSTLYTLHSTLYTPHSTLYTLHFTLYTPHLAFYTPDFTLYTPHCTLYTPHSSLYTPHSSLYTPHSTLLTLHSTLHTFHSTLHTPHFTLRIPHSTIYTLYS